MEVGDSKFFKFVCFGVEEVIVAIGGAMAIEANDKG
jgi:hypothetical protein